MQGIDNSILYMMNLTFFIILLAILSALLVLFLKKLKMPSEIAIREQVTRFEDIGQNLTKTLNDQSTNISTLLFNFNRNNNESQVNLLTKINEILTSQSSSIEEKQSNFKDMINELLNKNTLNYVEREKKFSKEINEYVSTLNDIRNQIREKLPKSVLRTIQGSINPRKGKVGELVTYLNLLGTYSRIIPLGQPIDFIGISDDFIDFIEVKTGTSTLTDEERKIKNLIENQRIRFITRKEEVEVICEKNID
ncbi:MAG: Holliday junction resolvase-like protein [Candidatus Helarchaeota archaeon]